MAVITFMSDFGTEDHYVAAVKAAILRGSPDIRIVDISHTISPSDIGHASYVLKNVFRDFPEGSIHLCAVDSGTKERSRQLAVKLEKHFFVGADSGLFSLISETPAEAIVELKMEGPVTFTAKDILAQATSDLANGKNITELGVPLDQLKVLFARQLKVTKREIAGNVIRVDHYGNLITNINRKEFDTINRMNGGVPFEVTFGRERTSGFNESYHEVDSGEYFVIFNSNGFLQIGINKGNASELLGLKLDTPIIINFRI